MSLLENLLGLLHLDKTKHTLHLQSAIKQIHSSSNGSFGSQAHIRKSILALSKMLPWVEVFDMPLKGKGYFISLNKPNDSTMTAF